MKTNILSIEDKRTEMVGNKSKFTFYDKNVWDIFVRPGEVVEVRIPKVFGKDPAWGNEFAKGNVCGYFDNFEAFQKAVKAVDKAEHSGVYLTLQVIDPRLKGRAYNRLTPSQVGTSDQQVMAYRWLPVDIDPVRPSGISATDEEVAAAIETREKIKKHLAEKYGFNPPISAHTGNGGHLLYMLPDMDVEDAKMFCKSILNGLARDFGTADVNVDTGVFNPSRIWKLYGTRAKKGDPTPERPHRQSYIDDISIKNGGCTPLKVESIRAALKDYMIPEEQAHQNQQRPSNEPFDGQRLDVGAYLSKYGHEVIKIKPHGSSVLYILKGCIFNPEEHTAGESAIGQTSEGKLFYQCFHETCQGRTWHDARAEISGSDPLFERKSSYNRQETAPKVVKRAPISEKKDLSFPFKIMTGAAGYFADTYVDYIEAPAQFLFIAYLACLGAVISPWVWLKSELDTQARIFAVLLGESATERKSTTLTICAKLFRAVVEDFNICWGVGSAEGLQKVLKRKTRHDNKPMGTLLTYDELKAFVSKCNIDSSVLLPIVNTLFEGNLYETHTKKQSINIDNAYLSMMAATTINTYNRIFNAAFLDIGFPNRVFLVSGTAERKHSIPKKIPEHEAARMRGHLISVLQHVGEGLELDVTPEAKEIYHQWYMNLEQTIHAKRLDTYSLRFMMLLAINNLKNEIDVETVEHAIALCDWQLEVRKQYDPIDAEGKTAQMEESIRRALKREPMKDYGLKQATNANRLGLWVFESAKKNLERGGEISWDPKGKVWFYDEQK